MHGTRRRDFLKASAASLAAAGIGSTVVAAQEESPTGIPVRPLGDTGKKVSIIGIGGYHIGVPDPREGIAIMHEAIDEGVTFFDNAWDYHNGGSEEVMGKALATGGRRDKVFLMTKNCNRDHKGSMQCLEDSLRRLKTDRIDLWQFHEINWAVDPDWIYEQGGLKAAIEARKAGKVRYIGFTGHRHVNHHLGMLAKDFDWDTVQMPINILDAHYRSFQNKVLPVCTKRKIGVVGMKGLAGGNIPRQLEVSAEVCRRYALSLPISTLVCGIRSREELRQDVAIARSFKPMTDAEMEKLRTKHAQAASDGRHEPFKSNPRYGSAHHRKQHEKVDGKPK